MFISKPFETNPSVVISCTVNRTCSRLSIKNPSEVTSLDPFFTCTRTSFCFICFPPVWEVSVLNPKAPYAMLFGLRPSCLFCGFLLGMTPLPPLALIQAELWPFGLKSPSIKRIPQQRRTPQESWN